MRLVIPRQKVSLCAPVVEDRAYVSGPKLRGTVTSQRIDWSSRLNLMNALTKPSTSKAVKVLNVSSNSCQDVRTDEVEIETVPQGVHAQSLNGPRTCRSPHAFIGR